MDNDKLENRLAEIEHRLEKINFELGKLVGAQKTTTTLIKWIILPLIVILGALVGVKIF